MYYKNYIRSRGQCPSTNRQQYSTEYEAQKLADCYPSEGYKVIKCEDCGYYHLVKKKSSSDVSPEKNSELNSFYEQETKEETKPELDVETATKFLEENGYVVCEVDHWNKIGERIQMLNKIIKITRGEE